MNDPGTPSASTEKSFEALGIGAAKHGVSISAMFGKRALKVAGKAFASLWGDSLVFKLSGDAHARALALKGAARFDPSGMNRPMKQWIVVPKAHAKEWASLAEAARVAVAEDAAAAPQKKATPKKSALKKR